MANGLFGGGNGTTASPYIVEDAQDLNAVRNNLSAHYKQTKNIDLSSYANWLPIGDGNNNNKFTGVYDGDKHVVFNLVVSRTTIYNGLFGYLERAKVLNLGVKGQVNGGQCTGGLSGYNRNGQITDCFFEGVVTGSKDVGGLVGINYPNSKILNCYVNALVKGVRNVGGITGDNDSSIIEDTFFLGSKIERINDSYPSTFGDIAGSLYSIITNCHSLDVLQFVTPDNTIFNGTIKSTSRITNEQAKQRTTYEVLGWDFSTIWKINEGRSYPYLWNEQVNNNNKLGVIKINGDLKEINKIVVKINGQIKEVKKVISKMDAPIDAPLFFDDFNHTDSSTLGGKWGTNIGDNSP